MKRQPKPDRAVESNPDYIRTTCRATTIRVNDKPVRSMELDGEHLSMVLRDMAKWGRK